jgi:hypothetical protein
MSAFDPKRTSGLININPLADTQQMLIRLPGRRARPSLLSWRDEGFPFLNDINRVQFDGLISRAFIVNGAVGKWYRLPRVQDLFRLAVDMHPEVTLYHMSYYHAGMVMTPGLEARRRSLLWRR